MLSLYNFKPLALLSAISVAWTQTITSTNGTISGLQCDGYDVNSFLSIPYAQPPVGDLRFAAPVPYNKKYSGGALNATSPAPRCIQFGDEFVGSGTTSEDW